MMEKLWKVVKAGAVMFLAGALLAASAPLIAEAIGEAALGSAAYTHALATPVLWTAAFFGAFGAIHAVVAPLFDKVDGTSKRTEIAQARIDAHIKEAEHEVTPEREVLTSYQRKLEDERLGAAVSIQIS